MSWLIDAGVLAPKVLSALLEEVGLNDANMQGIAVKFIQLFKSSE